MDFEALRNEYMDQMNNTEYLANNPNFADRAYRQLVADKMLATVTNDDSRHDYLKYNDAMRRAARKFGFKTTAQFKTALKVKDWTRVEV